MNGSTGSVSCSFLIDLIVCLSIGHMSQTNAHVDEEANINIGKIASVTVPVKP